MVGVVLDGSEHDEMEIWLDAVEKLWRHPKSNPSGSKCMSIVIKLQH